MGVYKWMCRVGTPGQTARTIAKQVGALREADHHLTRRKAAESVLGLRCMVSPYTADQMELIDMFMSRPDADLVDLVTAVVLAESNTRPSHLGEKYAELRDVIREELTKHGTAISDWL